MEEHHRQQQQRSHHNPPISIPKPLVDDHDPSKPKAILPISFSSNGAVKKHRLQRRPPFQPEPNSPSSGVYMECLKNHAASLGGHALDGCGEFIPSPDSDPSVPTSLTCAACACHRNFHRRVLWPPDSDPPPVSDRGEIDGADHHSSSPPAAPYCSSAPHMLMALSAGQGGRVGADPPSPCPSHSPSPSYSHREAEAAVRASAPATNIFLLPRKRIRSKFSAEQKWRMLELGERLGWRMQKRDEAVVERFCHEIGIGKRVFKVWMQNNKHTNI